MATKKNDPLIEIATEDTAIEVPDSMVQPVEEPQCQICSAKHHVEDCMALVSGALKITAHDYSGLGSEDEAPLFEVIHKDATTALEIMKVLVEMRELLLKCDCEETEEASDGPSLIDYDASDNPSMANPNSAHTPPTFNELR